MSDTAYETALYERAKSMLNTQGVIAIVFGSLGSLFSLLLVIGFIISAFVMPGEFTAVENFIYGIVIFIFGFIPHTYLVVSGITLVRQPRPAVARTLTIINLVVGVMSNLIVLIFSIISLTQINDYGRHFLKEKK